MSKSTPGPWAATLEEYRWVIDCQGEFGPKKALAVTAGFYPKHEANARLIAAAPELLEFAEEVRRSGDTRLASMAIAVISKATGANK